MEGKANVSGSLAVWVAGMVMEYDKCHAQSVIKCGGRLSILTEKHTWCVSVAILKR